MPADTQIFRGSQAAGNSDYTLPGNLGFRLKAVAAEFDGSGAGSAWLPAVVLISDAGHIIARAATSSAQVAAGASAEVSFFPGAGLGGGAGIQYDTANLGDWLQVETDGFGAAVTTDITSYTGLGVGVVADNGANIVIGTNGAGDVHVDSGDLIELSVVGTVQGNADLQLDGGLARPIFLAENFADFIFNGTPVGSTFTVLVEQPIIFQATGGTTEAVVQIRQTDGNYFSVFKDDLSKEWLRAGSAGIFMFHLPTSNPGVSGQLWNSAGVVHIVP